MGTSQSVAMARKLTTSKLKTRSVIVPKEKVIKAEPRQRKVSKKDDEARSLNPSNQTAVVYSTSRRRVILETDQKAYGLSRLKDFVDRGADRLCEGGIFN